MTSASGSGQDVIEFAREAYALEAIKRAAYRLSDRLLVEIEPGDRTIACTITLRTPVDPNAGDPIEAFKLEVLDQDLRSSICAETEGVRNLILAYAFSKTGLQGE